MSGMDWKGLGETIGVTLLIHAAVWPVMFALGGFLLWLLEPR